jgi:hypothetical protein
MNIHEALETAQDAAHTMLVEQFDLDHGIPLSASSHTDLWPGDRWPEAYLAAGEPEFATMAMNSIARSVRPDGSFPHLMQGSHVRNLGPLGNSESRWIDRQVYRIQGNGAVHLSNGEWVTKIFAPPTQALGVLALVDAGYAAPGSLNAAKLEMSVDVLYNQRANFDGLITARHRDELTRRTGYLSNNLDKYNGVVDPAINALAVLNDTAIATLSRLDKSFNSFAASLYNGRRSSNMSNALYDLLSTADATHGLLSPEEVLAAARLGSEVVSLSEQQLANFYKAPDPTDKHPERTHLNMAYTIEVARLTPDSEASHSYLERILPAIAAKPGYSGILEYEDRSPKDDITSAVTNKLYRSKLWLPTAAELVQLDASNL